MTDDTPAPDRPAHFKSVKVGPGVAPEDEQPATDLNAKRFNDIIDGLRHMHMHAVADALTSMRERAEAAEARVAELEAALRADRDAVIEECASVVASAGLWKLTGKDRDYAIAAAIRALKGA